MSVVGTVVSPRFFVEVDLRLIQGVKKGSTNNFTHQPLKFSLSCLVLKPNSLTANPQHPCGDQRSQSLHCLKESLFEVRKTPSLPGESYPPCACSCSPSPGENQHPRELSSSAPKHPRLFSNNVMFTWFTCEYTQSKSIKMPQFSCLWVDQLQTCRPTMPNSKEKEFSLSRSHLHQCQALSNEWSTPHHPLPFSWSIFFCISSDRTRKVWGTPTRNHHRPIQSQVICLKRSLTQHDGLIFFFGFGLSRKSAKLTNDIYWIQSMPYFVTKNQQTCTAQAPTMHHQRIATC